MRHVRKIVAFLVVLYTITLLAGADQFMSSAFADLPQPLIIRTGNGETTVGSVQILRSDSVYAITLNVDDEYEIYSSIVTFRFNSGGVTRVKSFGRDDDCVTKTKTQHRYHVSAEQIKGDDVQVAASAMVICDGKTFLTPKVFARIVTPTTSTTEVVTTTSIPGVTTTVPQVTTTSLVPATTSTTKRRGGVAITTTTTTPPQAVQGQVVTTSTTKVAAVTTTTAPPRVTTTTIPERITTTTLPPAITTTTEARPPRERERLPVTGSELNWYMVGSLMVAAGLVLLVISSINSRSQRRSRIWSDEF